MPAHAASASQSESHPLLICTVGGTADPIIASLKHWRPDRVLFISSTNTRALILEQILPAAGAAGIPLAPGAYAVYPVDDPQDLTHCVRRIRLLRDEVNRWTGRGDGYAVIVDLTGGTKCLTAAAALCAQRWPCCFSYIGGGERSRSGVGTVISGSEQTFPSANPWNALGYQAVEDAAHLFNHGDYAAAAELLKNAGVQATDPPTKRTLSTLSFLAQAYAAWDRFDHRTALGHLQNVRKNVNDFCALFGAAAQPLMEMLETHYGLLEELERTPPTSSFIADLLANARRCADRQRFDDAVARLYRAIEALAQFRLRDAFQLDASAILWNQLPATLQERWKNSANDGVLKLGLQQCFALLDAHGDPLGARFHSLALDADTSPLTSRNSSILAHGFQPVGQAVFDKLWEAALDLTEVTESHLPRFPTLPSTV